MVQLWPYCVGNSLSIPVRPKIPRLWLIFLTFTDVSLWMGTGVALECLLYSSIPEDQTEAPLCHRNPVRVGGSAQPGASGGPACAPSRLFAPLPDQLQPQLR